MNQNIDYELWIDGAAASKHYNLMNLVALRQQVATPAVFALAEQWEEDQVKEPEDTHWLVQRYGDLAIINIKGVLVEGHASWWSWRDEVGYGDIRNAATAAANAGAKAGILKFDTPGGMVKGVGACSDFLTDLGKVMPLYSYTDTQCASGGVWLAASTGRFWGSQHAEVGSIGVMQMIVEVTEADKQMGINRRVFKSAPLKGYGNPYEKLSEKAAKEIEKRVVETSGRFEAHVAKGLKIDPAYVHSTLATGQMWYGDQALNLGLLQKNLSLDQLLVDLQKKVAQNTPKPGATLPVLENREMQQKNLSPGLQDAIAKAAVAMTGEQSPVEGADLSAAAPIAEAEEAEKVVGEVPATPEAAAAPEGEVKTGLDQMLATVTSLTDQLITSKMDVANYKGQAERLKSELEAAQTSLDSLKDIAVSAVQWAFVAAGSPAPDEAGLKALSAPLLIKQHTDAMAIMSTRLGEGGRKTSMDAKDEASEGLDDAASNLDSVVLLPLSRIGSR